MEPIKNKDDKNEFGITTIKLSKRTKDRIDHLKVYKRETYEDILQRMLEILNVCRLEPERARNNLIIIDKERKRNLNKVKIVIDKLSDREDNKRTIQINSEGRTLEKSRDKIKNLNENKVNKFINKIKR